MKRISFGVRYPPSVRHPMHRRLEAVDGVSRAEMLLWSPAGSVKTLFWCDGPPTAVEELFATTASVVGTSLVEGDGGTYALVRQDDYEFPGDLMSFVSRSQVIFVPPVTFRESGRVELEAVGDASHLRTLYDGLRERGDATIRRVTEYRRSPAESMLTDRQRAALDAAVDAGYYDVPRTGHVADVAAELGCSTSTAHELLRKAEAVVMREHADE